MAERGFATGNTPDALAGPGELRASIGADWILCGIACGTALLALGAALTSTGTAVAGCASCGAGFAGGRSSGDGNAVGGDEIEFADQLPLCDGFKPSDELDARVEAPGGGDGGAVRGGAAAGAAGDGAVATGDGVAASFDIDVATGGMRVGSAGDDDRLGGAGDGVCGRGGNAADDARFGGAGEGVCGRGGEGTGGRGTGGTMRAGAGTAGTFASGGGVGTRGAVIDFGRGAFAGTGTIGLGLVESDCSDCDPRGDDAGGRSAGCGGVVCSGTGGAGAGSGPGDIKRSSATSRSESSPEDLASATRDHHCRSMLAVFAM